MIFGNGIRLENVVTPNDYQATLLHLFGLDAQQLVYHHNGQEQKLTAGRECRVVREILKNPEVAGSASSEI